jgi:glycosyltransferase involved in cell wall biosynthesis
MKILLLVQDWISFYNQAEALALGLRRIGVDFKMVLVTEIEKSDDVYKTYKPDLVVGIGSWHSYYEFVKKPMSLGIKVLPWIVSDDLISDHIEGYNQLDLVLTTSNYCKSVFIRDGIKPEKIKILAEAVDNDFWKKINKTEENFFLKMLSVESSFKIEEKYNLVKAKSEGVPIVFTMGGDVTSKGSQEVLRALANLDKNLKWFYLMKAWPQEHTFKRGQEEFALIKTFGLENRIRYMVTDFSREFVRNLINICDIYVAPSRGEGFGLPFVQAELCEKAIISVEALSIVDVVDNGKTAFLAKPMKENNILKANINDLTIYLDRLIRDKDLREKMGKDGRKFAVSKFNPKFIAKKLVNYINLLKNE